MQQKEVVDDALTQLIGPVGIDSISDAARDDVWPWFIPNFYAL